MSKMSENACAKAILEVLDSMALKLTNYGHHWTEQERADYEMAAGMLLEVIDTPPVRPHYLTPGANLLGACFYVLKSWRRYDQQWTEEGRRAELPFLRANMERLAAAVAQLTEKAGGDDNGDHTRGDG